MYDAIRGFWRERKKDFIVVAIGIAVFLVGFCAGYFCGIRNAGKTDGSDVSNHGTGISAVGNELSTAKEHQQQITDGLESAVGRSDSIEARSDKIKKTAGEAASAVTDAGRIIDECQQIVGRIRNRGQKGTSAN